VQEQMLASQRFSLLQYLHNSARSSSSNSSRNAERWTFETTPGRCGRRTGRRDDDGRQQRT